jgi:hypothetical protein
LLCFLFTAAKVCFILLKTGIGTGLDGHCFTHNYPTTCLAMRALTGGCFEQIRITLKPQTFTIMYSYDTVTEALTGLKERGFEYDFNLQENCLVCQEHKFQYEDFEIVEVYRFEGNTDPADEAIVYGIESVNGIKGVLVSGYGASSDQMSTEMAKKLQIQR